MLNQKTGKIKVRTSQGNYNIVYEIYTKLPNDSVYEPENINAWISNFWWEIDEKENDELIKKDSEPKKTINCWHDWKEYVGFTEKYWYCEKCDNKSEEDPNYRIK